ncbi:tRNA (adenosine(37)-N6)-threonylcarbamoyltransferase complex dimerization subunit type 1 TsaB [Portibacter lacus]|uniref:tRNA (Adenosine(37)-N6)-threonylcarbamoyltransferase complex dimerization subunit type 1 TsaB n=1 Tax=Portibacter lacus TaxID=1099794 RepID=A0AA37SSF8_9BACT|nr:tRNA (adenosine(37)-N6)-threonylcarbamoyltransferase complex dimerization subunit type 1 TsaB [Portibacter lacus]GLR18649.1 tRNA (adenosine(37)-N6)-threonylcarbamoyltransferase complex dimerization subunit type 1 TsaB [Portibacter lacus]
MAKILSLESSSEVCSVCVSDENEILSLIETTEPFSHTRKMTLFIQQCLSEANISMQELDAVAVSDGPGSYTGLRVSAATAKGICFGLQIPLITVNTLEAIATHASSLAEGDLYIPMIDARRMEVYTSTYNNKLEEVKETHNLILEEDSFNIYNGKKIVLCGTGVEKCKDVFKTKGYDFLPFRLSASYLLPLIQAKFRSKNFVDMISYSPNYFKAPKVTQSKKPLF